MPKMSEEVKAHMRAVAAKGGRARARLYPKKKLREWGKKGGRPKTKKPAPAEAPLT